MKPTVYIQVNKILRKKELSINKLAKLTGAKNSSGLNQMLLGNRPFPKTFIQKLLPILEVSEEEFKSWIIADKYTKEFLELVIKVKKTFPYKRKSVLTTKIDLILHEKGISRTTLSREIKYSQSGLNKIIIGKRSLSKSVLQRLSFVLEVPQDEILSWIIADKYSLEVLEMAWDCKTE